MKSEDNKSNMRSKKQLEMKLSRVRGFLNSKVSSEQYITPSDIASEVLWKAYMDGDIEGKMIIDLGSGTGILGIGCLLLGAKKVIFVDHDKEALDICKENLRLLESECETGNPWERDLVPEDISSYSESITSKNTESGTNDGSTKFDTVVTNPPFGTKKKHADKEFLIAALNLGKVTYSFHKTSTKDYILQVARANGKEMTERFDFKFMLRNTMKHHTKAKKYVEVSCFVFK